ncbi:MAG: tetratricopeptide repeat protein [Candidatus Thorarchaeota archaeon]
MTEERRTQALRAIDEGRILDAIQILEPLVKENPNNPDTLMYLGIAYVQAEKPAEAETVLRNAQALCEDHSVLSQFLGRALFSLEKLDEAEEELRKAIQLDPEAQEAWSDLGKVLFDKHDYGESVKVLKKGIARFPDDPSLRGTYALGIYRLGDTATASDQWKIMQEHHPELMVATVNFAYTLLVQDRIEEAIPHVETAFERDPSDYRSLVLKGMVLFEQKNYDEASKFFKKALDNSPGNILALSRLALISKIGGDDEQCEKYLEMAEKQAGVTPECWRGLCYAYSFLGQKEKYVHCLESWTKGDPGVATPWIELATEYEKNGETDRALRALTKTAKLRGYVKIHCSSCGNDTILEIDEMMHFDMNEEFSCSKCGLNIPVILGVSIS